MQAGNATRRRFVQQALAVAALPALSACGGGDASQPEMDYSAAVEGLIKTYRLPGVLAAVRRPGRSDWSRAFGKADLASNTALSLHSTFPVRSITKSFTVTLLLQLVREGSLALDETIDTFFAGVPNGNLITLADLAGNCSGLVDYSSTKAFFDLFSADLLRVWTEQQLVDFSFAQTPPFLPGAEYQYSNTNTVLLGMLVEQRTGLTLAAAMAARIFGPLGLEGTSYPYVATLPAPFPTPYSVDVVSGQTEQLPFISPTALAGSGAIDSTLGDLLDWGDALGSGSLIGAALQAERKGRVREVTNGPEYDRYGLGIGQIGAWWGHTGSGLGYQVATMNDAAGTTISVMVNATPQGARRDLNFAQEIFEALAAVVEAN